MNDMKAMAPEACRSAAPAEGWEGLGAPGAAGAQLLRAPQRALWVAQGSADIFLVALDGDERGGARTHLMTLAGGALFPGVALPAAAGYALMLCPGPDCRYLALARASLLEGLAQGRGDAGLAHFVRAVGAAWRPGPPAAAVRLLQPGEQVALEEPALVGAAAAGSWLELQSGTACYAGPEPKPELEQDRGAWLDCPALLPLSQDVSLAPGACARCLSAAQAGEAARHGAGAEAMLSGAEALLRALVAQAIGDRERGELRELERLQARSAIDQQALSEALGRFAALFGAGRQAPEGGGGDRLFKACQIAGRGAGIVFRAPPAHRTEGRRNPVAEIAEASGVRCRSVALKGSWWRQDNGPLVALLEEGQQAVALLPRRGGYRAIDPDSGAWRQVDAAYAALLQPFAHMFYAGLPSRPLTLRDTLAFVLRGIWRDVALVAAVCLLSALLGMAVPVAAGYLFDSVIPAADRSQLLQVVLLLLVASVVTLLFDTTRSLALLRIEGKAGSDLQAAVWDRVLSLPVPFFRRYSAGDLAMRINGINEVRQALSGTVIVTVLGSLFALVNVLVLFYYDARLAGIACAVLLLAVAVNVAIGWAGLRRSREAAHFSGRIAGMVLEYLSGIAKLRTSGAEARAYANWAAQFIGLRKKLLAAGLFSNLNVVVTVSYPLLAAMVIYLGAMPSDGRARLTSGEFIAFNAAFSTTLVAVLTLVRTLIGLLGVASAYERAQPILQEMPEASSQRPHPQRLLGGIELSNVSFAYDPALPPILDDVSIRINPGEFVALVGSSGSGKTTLLRLMLGFEQPGQGAVYYDGQNLAEVDIGAVRRQLGVVLQGGQLMSGDIYSNIVGSSLRTLDEAWVAARACGLDRDIEAMPMGMHSLVSDGGGTLSGGQRQRLLIARAIVNQPRVLFFDEATSALDNQTQSIVSLSMERLQATRVVIAHRLSTIINADRIFVLDRGKVVQTGTYAQLMSEGGLFAELAKRQIA